MIKMKMRTMRKRVKKIIIDVSDILEKEIEAWRDTLELFKDAIPESDAKQITQQLEERFDFVERCKYEQNRELYFGEQRPD